MSDIAQAINGGQLYQGLFIGVILGAIIGGLGVMCILEVGAERGWF